VLNQCFRVERNPLRHLSSDGSAWGGGATPLAKYFLEIASTADTWIVNFLRLTAADYLELAHAAEKPKPVVLQQQQPRPKEPQGEAR
jgi:hypothetical protein